MTFGTKRISREDTDWLYKAIEVRCLAREGRSGDFAVKRENTRQREWSVISMRQWCLGEYKPHRILLDLPLTVTSLTENGGVWMSDVPEEIFGMRDVRRLHGRVLVGGLGLGMTTMLAMLTAKTTGVVTVEISPNVIELTGYACIGEVVNACIFDYVDQMPAGKFDSAFFDSWTGTGEATFFSDIVPLRRSCLGKIDNRSIYCWEERTMRRQVIESTIKYCLAPDSVNHWWPYKAVIDHARRNGVKPLENIDDLEPYMTGAKEASPLLKQIAVQFANVGTQLWERRFGERYDLAFEQNEREITKKRRENSKISKSLANN